MSQISVPHSPSGKAERGPGRPGVIRLDEVEKEHLAGDGNWLYRIPWEGDYVVAKIYYGNRSPFLYLKKTFGNVVLTGRSSHMPRARCETEIRCVETWQRHGFRCFGLRPEIEIEGHPRDGYMVFEYVPGLHFREYFQDQSVPLEERMATWRRFVPEWHRRHQAAVETDDPNLIHENGDVKHVMLWEGDFVYFDFEMVYRSKHVRHLAGLEILCYMRSVGRFFGEPMYDRMMDELVEHYPDKALLMCAWESVYRHPNLVRRLGRFLDPLIKPSRRKRFAKYTVARDLKRRLDELSLT